MASGRGRRRGTLHAAGRAAGSGSVASDHRSRALTADSVGRRCVLLRGAADEASFVLGPAIVGVLAALASPAAAIVVAAVLLAVFGSLFATHRTSALVPGQARRAVGGTVRLPSFLLLTLGGAQLIIGIVFGSVQTGTSVLATEAGVAGMTGLLHALLGVGSVLAGLAVSVIPPRISHETRLVIFATGLVVLSAPLLVVDSLGSLAVVLLVMGVVVAPYMITVFTLAEQRSPPTRVGTMMTLLAGSTGLGYAVGSTTAGRLADAWGYTAAFAVALIAATLATALVNLTHRRLGSGRVMAIVLAVDGAGVADLVDAQSAEIPQQRRASTE